MEMLETAIIAIHVIVSLALVGLVLLQQGKGAEAGASFGGGASQTVFGSQGSGNFLTRSTSLLAVVFFVTSISLAVIAKQRAEVAAAGGEDIVVQEAPVAELPATDSDASYEQSMDDLKAELQKEAEAAQAGFADQDINEVEGQAVPEIE